MKIFMEMMHAGEWGPVPRGQGKGPGWAFHVAVIFYFFKRERYEADVAKYMHLKFGKQQELFLSILVILDCFRIKKEK